jgi:hypothetical protein
MNEPRLSLFSDRHQDKEHNYQTLVTRVTNVREGTRPQERPSPQTRKWLQFACILAALLRLAFIVWGLFVA